MEANNLILPATSFWDDGASLPDKVSDILKILIGSSATYPKLDNGWHSFKLYVNKKQENIHSLYNFVVKRMGS